MSVTRAAAAAAMLVGAASAASAQQPIQQGSVHGIVYDSVARVPLAGARVELVPLADRAHIAQAVAADSAGAFAIHGIAPGRYLVGFEHPMLDSLGIAPPMSAVDVAAGEDRALPLAVPAPARIRDAVCGTQSDSAGALVGTLADAGSGAPLAGGTVSAAWLELSVVSGHLQRARPRVTAQSGADGWFVLCGLPVGSPFSLQASAANDTSAVLTLQVADGGLLRRSIYLGGTRIVNVAVADSASGGATVTRSYVRGVERLAGRVHAIDGRPIVGARVEVPESGLSAVTGDSGRFELPNLPGGTRAVQTRAVGYYPDTRTVDLVGGRTTVIEVALPTLKSVLDTVRITASRTRLFDRNVEAFEARRRQNGEGTFINSATIDRLKPTRASDILRQAPSVSLIAISLRDGRTVWHVRSRGENSIVMGGQGCLPKVIVNGTWVPLMQDVLEIDTYVQADELRAVEVYTPSNAPPEFKDERGCATVVMWTGPARPRGAP